MCIHRGIFWAAGILIAAQGEVLGVTGASLDKLAAAARQQREAALTKKSGPAARRVVGGVEQAALLDKLATAARQQREAAMTKEVLARPGRAAWVEKLQQLSRQQQARAMDKPPVLFPARKPLAVQQADEDARGAVDITYGERSGLLSPAGEEDEYSFSGAMGDVLDIALSSEEFDTFLELELDGEVIGVDDDGGEGTNSLLDDFTLPEDGEYLVRVRAFDESGAGVYSLSVNQGGVAAAYQGALSPGTRTGALDEAAPAHLFIFTLGALSQVQLSLVSEDFDAFLTLYVGDGPEDQTEDNLLAVDDDGGEGFNSLLESQLEEGSYLVEVRSFSGTATGDYALSLQVTALGNDEDSGGPLAIAYGQEREGGLFPAGDFDDYVFTASAGEVVDISLVSEDFDAYVELVYSGQVIGVDDDGGEGFNSLLDDFVLPATGQYQVRARSYSDAGSGSYTLTVSAAAAPWTFSGSLSPGEVEGELEEGGDIHFYTFALRGFSQVQLDLVSEDFDAFLVLYAGDGPEDRSLENQLASDDDGGGGLNSQIAQQLSAGSYLVEVRSFSSTATGGYTLGLQVVGLGADEDGSGVVGIGYGQSLEGGIFPAGDVDEYTFTGRAGEAVDISLESEDFDAYVELVYSGQVIGADDDGGEGFNSLLDDFVLPATGQYQVRAHVLGDNGTGVYTVGVEDVTPPLVANSRIAPGTYAGQIAEAGELQVYPFTLSELSLAQIDLISEEFDAFLSLYAGDSLEDRAPENLLAEDDDGGEGVNARIELLLPAGDYLIEARPLFHGATGGYELELEFSSVEGDEDSSGPAAIAYGQEREGQILPSGDVDRYAFSGSAGEVVDISLTSEDFDAFLELEYNGRVIASDDDGGEDLNSLLDDFVLPRSGQYLARVHVLGDEGTGAYEISVQSASGRVGLNSLIAPGNYTGQLAAGQVQVYPFALQARAEVQIDLNSAQFASAVALYTGQTLADRQAANRVIAAASTSAGQAAHIVQELPAGNYLIEARAATPDRSGTYELSLKVAVAQQARDRIALRSGQLNGQTISPFAPVVQVSPGEKISGTLEIEVENTHPRSAVFPVGATPTWGDHRTSFWEIEDWAAPGTTQLAVRVDLNAPEAPGTYHLILAGAAELAVADIMSGTHYTQAAERWDDGDDVAAWSAARLSQAIQNGWVNVDWFDRYNADIAAYAVRVEVAEPVAVASGPVSLDFDLGTGDQGQRRLEGVAVGQTIQVQLHVNDAPRMNGWSIQLQYNPDQVRYVGSSFIPSTFIQGLVSLEIETPGQVEVGGTVLGSASANSGDGLLGTLSFEVLSGFAASTNLVVSQVSLRTTDSGQIKESTQAVGTLVAGVQRPTGPISLDFDLAAGDQGRRQQDGVQAGQTIQVQLNVAGAPQIRGWSARLEYDPTQVRYVSSSFAPSDFIPRLVVLVGEKAGRVEVGGTVLGAGAGSAGDATLGALSFQVLGSFSGSAELVITRISFNTVDSGEVIQEVHAVASLSAQVALPGDFDGSRVVDFSDFFLFADNFGKAEGDPGWDPLFDLNSNGEVDFSDFFLFADNFGREAQAKLLALARRYLGLPAGARLEQNYPNPFNASTAIRYQLLAPGFVRLEVFDLGGQRLRTLVAGAQEAGVYQVNWDGRDQAGEGVASGVYFLRLEAGQEIQARKVLLLR